MSILLGVGILVMASGVDSGWTHNWSPIAQGVYVLFMMLGLLYAVLGSTAAWGAFRSGADTVPSVTANGYFQLMALVMLALTIARVLDLQSGWSFTRSGSAIVGLVGLYLSVRPPVWLLGDSRIAGLRRVIGFAGVRLLYGAIGLACVLAALTGWPPFMRVRWRAP